MNSALSDLATWPTKFWVRAVLIQNLTGQLQDLAGSSKSLSNSADRAHLIKLRNSADLVIAGASTIRIENPPAPATKMWVLTNSGELSDQAKVFQSSQTSVVTTKPINHLPSIMLDEITPAKLLEQAKSENLTRILLEGGSTVFDQFIAAGLIDEALITLVDRVGAGDIVHRARFGLTLTQQIRTAELTIQRWCKEG